MKRQSGFTLIELVMVIVILGILSAFALPRFADLGGQARAASIEGIAGAIRSASAIVHADALVNNQTGATGAVTLDGQNIDLINGYATVNNTTTDEGQDDIVEAAQIDLNDTNLVISATDDTLTIQIAGAAVAANCQVTYAESGGAAPDIVLDSSNC